MFMSSRCNSLLRCGGATTTSGWAALCRLLAVQSQTSGAPNLCTASNRHVSCLDEHEPPDMGKAAGAAVVCIHGYTDSARLGAIASVFIEGPAPDPSRPLGTTGAGVEPDVGFVGLPPVGLEIQRAAGPDVDDRRYGQSHQHRDVRAAQSLRNRALEMFGAEKRDHRRESDAVRGQPAPTPAAVHAMRVEDLTHRVVTLAHHIEIHQVDGGPGRE